jgi:hypothetical protein
MYLIIVDRLLTGTPLATFIIPNRCNMVCRKSGREKEDSFNETSPKRHSYKEMSVFTGEGWAQHLNGMLMDIDAGDGGGASGDSASSDQRRKIHTCTVLPWSDHLVCAISDATILVWEIRHGQAVVLASAIRSKSHVQQVGANRTILPLKDKFIAITVTFLA